MRRVSTRVLPEPAGARIASGACGSVTAARWCASRSASNESWSAHAGDRTGRLRRSSLRARRSRAPGRGKAPSSLRCIAAPISSGPVPRPPSLSAGSPRRRPRRPPTARAHAAPKGSARPAARAPVPSPPGGRSGVGAAANRHRHSTTAPAEGQAEISAFCTHGDFTFRNEEFSLRVRGADTVARRTTNGAIQPRGTRRTARRTVAPRRYRWSHGDRAGSGHPPAQARRGGPGR